MPFSLALASDGVSENGLAPQPIVSNEVARVLEIINEKGLIRLSEPVKLACGVSSSEFIDGKAALSRWEYLRTACEAIVAEVTEGAGINFDAAGGLTLGADSLAVGVAAAADSCWFTVRKERKQRGTQRLIEGARLDKNSKVLLLDDVVTTGKSALQAFEAIKDETDAQVVAAAVLVDRGDTAQQRFKEIGVPYFPLLTYQELNIPPVVPPEG